MTARKQSAPIAHPQIDAHRVAERIWVGAYPANAIGKPALLNDFDLLVLCAKELQASSLFKPIKVHHCPIDDALRQPTAQEWQQVLRAAQQVAVTVRDGGRALVTCRMGANRSALVAAKAISMLNPDAPMPEIIRAVQERRRTSRGVLFNPYFVQALKTR